MKFAQVNWYSSNPLKSENIRINVITGDLEKMKELLKEQMSIDMLDLWAKRALDGDHILIEDRVFFRMHNEGDEKIQIEEIYQFARLGLNDVYKPRDEKLETDYSSKPDDDNIPF